MIIDRLVEEIRQKSFVCVGLDTCIDYVPPALRKETLADSLFSFNKEIIDATKDIVAIYKVQIAYYEQYGLEGMQAYANTVAYLRDQGLLSIGDVKRGDIASTAQAYAKAHFQGDFEVDIITVNAMMGLDTLDYYLPYIEHENKGIYVLVRTSNPGAKDFEYMESEGQAMYYHMADKIYDLGQNFKGATGYSAVGMVVGGTQKEEITEIRKRYENIPFLIPGYGAQGGVGKDVRRYLGDGEAGVVNSSRGIILNFKNYADGQERVGHYARQAVLDMIQDIKGE